MKRLIPLLLTITLLACAPKHTINQEYHPWNHLAKNFKKELRDFYFLGNDKKTLEENLASSKGIIPYLYGDERRGALQIRNKTTKLSYGLIDGKDSLIFVETPVKFNIFYINEFDTLELDDKSKSDLYQNFLKFSGGK